jgi:tetratricopeptide (TPR) repeat protein
VELEGGAMEAALGAFAAALREDPESVEALAGTSLAYLEHGDRAKALDVLTANEHLLLRTPALQRVRIHVLRRGHGTAAGGGDPPADEIERRLGPPQDSLEFFVLGFHELVQADSEPSWDDACRDGHRRALELFTQATERARTARPLYWFLRAFAAGRCRDEKAARASAAVLAAHWPRSASARAHAGLALVLVDPESALGHFEAASELRPDDPVTRGAMGDALHGLGRAEEAIAAYRDSLRLAPARYESALNLAAELLDVGRADEAAAELERIRKLVPDTAAIALNLANARDCQGRQQEALDLYGEAMRMDRGCVPAWTGAGAILAQLGQHEEAVVHFREAVRLDPRSVPAWLSLGSCLRTAGELDDAIAALRRVVELDAGNWYGWEMLAASLTDRGELGDLGAARAAYARIVELASPGESGPRAVAAACAALTTARSSERARQEEAASATATRPERQPSARPAGELRDLALHWLQSELDAWREALRSGAADKAKVRAALRDLRGRPALQVFMRQLDSLPAEEQQAWRSLWDAISALLNAVG